MTNIDILKSRILKVANRIVKNEAFITSNPTDIEFFTGLKTSKGWLYIDENKKVLGVDKRYTFKSSVVDVVDFKNFINDDKKIHVSSGCVYDDICMLKNHMNSFRDWNISSIFEEARMVKHDWEIELIVKAAKICKRVLRKVTKKLQEGIIGRTEIELARFIKAEIFIQGGDGIAFDPIVAFEEHAAIPHHNPTNKKYQTGQVILIDFGVQKLGYCVDVARTYTYKSKANNIYKVIYNVKQECEKFINIEETSFGELSKESYKLIKSYDIKGEVVHSLGHGIGMNVHELPRLNNDSEEIVRNNIVFTIEPGIYIDKEFGVRLEDTYAIIDNKLCNLTKI